MHKSRSRRSRACRSPAAFNSIRPNVLVFSGESRELVVEVPLTWHLGEATADELLALCRRAEPHAHCFHLLPHHVVWTRSPSGWRPYTGRCCHCAAWTDLYAPSFLDRETAAEHGPYAP